MVVRYYPERHNIYQYIVNEKADVWGSILTQPSLKVRWRFKRIFILKRIKTLFFEILKTKFLRKTRYGITQNLQGRFPFLRGSYRRRMYTMFARIRSTIAQFYYVTPRMRRMKRYYSYRKPKYYGLFSYKTRKPTSIYDERFYFFGSTKKRLKPQFLKALGSMNDEDSSKFPRDFYFEFLILMVVKLKIVANYNEAKKFMSLGMFFVDNKPVYHPFFCIYPGSILTINPRFRNFFFKRFLRRMSGFIQRSPRHMPPIQAINRWLSKKYSSKLLVPSLLKRKRLRRRKNLFFKKRFHFLNLFKMNIFKKKRKVEVDIKKYRLAPLKSLYKNFGFKTEEQLEQLSEFYSRLDERFGQWEREEEPGASDAIVNTKKKFFSSYQKRMKVKLKNQIFYSKKKIFLVVKKKNRRRFFYSLINFFINKFVRKRKRREKRLLAFIISRKKKRKKKKNKRQKRFQEHRWYRFYEGYRQYRQAIKYKNFPKKNLRRFLGLMFFNQNWVSDYRFLRFLRIRSEYRYNWDELFFGMTDKRGNFFSFYENYFKHVAEY